MDTWAELALTITPSVERAIVSAGITWSGTDLVEHASGAATWLDELDIPTGATVPALVATNPEAVALVLAGAATGRPIAPLGTRLNERELVATLEQIEGEVLLAAEEFAEIGVRVASGAGKKLQLITTFTPSTAAIETRRHPDDVAALIHTSGTTGLPKPVPYRNRPLLERVRVNGTLMGLEPGCAYATASPFHHIAGLGNVFVAIGRGATLVSMERFSIDEWRRLEELGVTHAFAAATMVEMLLDQGALHLKDLRLLQYGASVIRPTTLRSAMDTLPGVDFINFYGQTEGSPISVLTPDDHRQAVDGHADLLTSVGRAPDGVDLRIREPDDQGIGEVLARAAHLFRTDDDGWLHTGDLGRLDDNGYLFLTGRKGDLIIRGGENVYPVEVEDVLIKHAAVRDVGVVGRPDDRLGEVVKAYVVPSDSALPPAPEELRAFTREQLSGFKVPSLWEFVDVLPRDTSGKLLRRRLD